MKQRKLTTVIVGSMFALATFTATADASWLSRQLDKLNDALGGPAVTSSSSEAGLSDDAEARKGNRWIFVEENPSYKLYIDKRSMKAGGAAQNRWVAGFFKREYTPSGSQALGANSGGRVKPDVITMCIYPAEYKVSSYEFGTYINSNGYMSFDHPRYYDVHHNLIYDGYLWDLRGGGEYTPDSPQEQLKDRLFHMFGWDY